MKDEKILCKGKFAEIGQNDTEFHHKTFENKKIYEDFHDVKNHDDAFNHLKEILKEIYNFKVLLLANGRIEQER